jgi:hypothetical protein
VIRDTAGYVHAKRRTENKFFGNTETLRSLRTEKLSSDGKGVAGYSEILSKETVVKWTTVS